MFDVIAAGTQSLRLKASQSGMNTSSVEDGTPRGYQLFGSLQFAADGSADPTNNLVEVTGSDGTDPTRRNTVSAFPLNSAIMRAKPLPYPYTRPVVSTFATDGLVER